MRHTIASQFIRNYVLMFILSIMITIFVLLVLDFANHMISTTLVKNNYTAESLMQDDYRKIKTNPVIETGGGVQVIDSGYAVVLSKGLNTLTKDKLNAAEFTDFLIASQRKGIPYSYSIAYNEKEKFWLVVTFPTSFRIDLAIVYNEQYSSVDRQNVIAILIAILMLYLLLLALTTVIYSKITSIGIVNPLRKLTQSARQLRNGDYTARVDLKLKNEFAELQDTFNTMADQIQYEMELRKQSEENRKQLVLDISHDLKNPLASILGYAELCRNKPDLSNEERDAYLRIVCENGLRANHLITNLFELSKMESSEFVLDKTTLDICEYMREQMGALVPLLDKAGFSYAFDIPEEEGFVKIDTKQMNRVLQNLVANTLQYNPRGTNVNVQVMKSENEVLIRLKDNGVGIAKEMVQDIFKPFVREDRSRNSQTGGTGLGLAIVEKIISAHGGAIELKTEKGQGCEFIIRLPRVI